MTDPSTTGPPTPRRPVRTPRELTVVAGDTGPLRIPVAGVATDSIPHAIALEYPAGSTVAEWVAADGTITRDGVDVLLDLASSDQWVWQQANLFLDFTGGSIGRVVRGPVLLTLADPDGQ